jgi:hypothetical protein
LVDVDQEARIDTSVRNLSRQETLWRDSTEACPVDLVEFKIEIDITGEDDIEDLTLRTFLNSKLIVDEDTIRINGIPTTKNIFSGAMFSILEVGKTKRINFTAQVLAEDQFGYGNTSLDSNARIVYDSDSDEDMARVIVSRGVVAGASTIATGTGNKLLDYFVLPLLIASLMMFILRNQFVLIGKWLKKKKLVAREYKANLKLRHIAGKSN